MPKLIASLFSGCGGLDLGFTGGFEFQGREFERLNTNIVFANDFDQDAANCYNANPLLTNDGVDCLLQDIRTVEADAIPDFQILLAGSPASPSRMQVIGKASMMSMEEVRCLRNVSVLSERKLMQVIALRHLFLKM